MLSEHEGMIQDNKKAIATETDKRQKADIAIVNQMKENKKASEEADKEHDRKLAVHDTRLDSAEGMLVDHEGQLQKHEKEIAKNSEKIESYKEDTKKESIAASIEATRESSIKVSRETAEAVVGEVRQEVQANSNAIASTRRELHDLRKDTENGLTAVAAMSVMDFKAVPVGKVGIGAAVGGYKSKQAVAVGVAYSPSDNLNFNGKVGIPISELNNTAYGVGVSYYFK